jgi:hypothetical protein
VAWKILLIASMRKFGHALPEKQAASCKEGGGVPWREAKHCGRGPPQKTPHSITACAILGGKEAALIIEDLFCDGQPIIENHPADVDAPCSGLADQA